MKDLENVEKAEAIVMRLQSLRKSYEALDMVGAHVNVCNHADQSKPAYPIDEELLPDIKALVKNKIEETWAKLKDLCYEEDDPEGQIGDGNPMVVEEGD